MKNRSFHDIITALVPRIYDFSFSICADTTKAELLVIDGHTAVMVSNQVQVEQIQELVDDETIKTTKIKKLLYKSIVQEIIKISTHFTPVATNSAFDKLSSLEKAYIFLKYKEQYCFEELLETLDMSRVQLIELSYQINYKLDLHVFERKEEKQIIATKSSYGDSSQLVLLNDSCSKDNKVLLEKENKEIELIELKLKREKLLKSLIPQGRLNESLKDRITSELESITRSFIPENKLYRIQKRVVKFMTTPVIEI